MQRQREIVYALAGFERRGREGTKRRRKKSLFRLLASRAIASTPRLSLCGGRRQQSIYRFRGADVTVFRQVRPILKPPGAR